MWSRSRRAVLALVATLVVGAGTVVAPSDAQGAPTLDAHGSVGQLWFEGAPANAPVLVVDPWGAARSLRTDANGALIVRNLAPGSGYRIRVGSGASALRSAPLTVTGPDDAPPASFYDSTTLVDGYQYITARDGTKLAAMVRLPGPAEDGPYPTVIEYSGYAAEIGRAHV